jgi:Spy/CpxP family protein refolding chaperone
MKRSVGTMMMAACILAWARPAVAQDHSPHANVQDREIKALSAEQVEQYLAGAGMGFALAAELNGYPGPRHVLDAADRLGVQGEQRRQIDAVFVEMNTHAVRLGAAIVEKERELDQLFAGGQATPSAVAALTGEIGPLNGELRAIHLRAHIQTRTLLTADQIRAYNHLRGYHDGHEHHGHGDPGPHR